MNISEMVSELQRIQQEKGDLEVMGYTGNGIEKDVISVEQWEGIKGDDGVAVIVIKQ